MMLTFQQVTMTLIYLLPCHAFSIPRAFGLRNFALRTCVTVQLSDVCVTIQRNEAGGLGIEVDADNVIAGTTQPLLMLGDVITAIDGESLAGRHVSRVLTPGAPSYNIIVRRNATEAIERLQRVLLKLSTEAAAGVEGLEMKAHTLINALVATGNSPSPESLSKNLLGFWRLRL